MHTTKMYRKKLHKERLWWQSTCERDQSVKNTLRQDKQTADL